ncbi:hypothetical protein D3C86_1389400 [compost metagenome]
MEVRRLAIVRRLGECLTLFLVTQDVFQQVDDQVLVFGLASHLHAEEGGGVFSWGVFHDWEGNHAATKCTAFTAVLQEQGDQTFLWRRTNGIQNTDQSVQRLLVSFDQ